MERWKISFFVMLLLTGCGSDNMSDALSRKKDIEREAAAQTTQDYEQVVGDYVTEDGSDREVKASIQVVRVKKEGSVIPQPMLTGNLMLKQVTDRRSVLPSPSASTSDVEAPFAFSNGTYDPGSKDLVLQIPGVNTPGIFVSCKVFPHQQRMRCDWIPLGPGDRFRFVLRKVFP